MRRLLLGLALLALGCTSSAPRMGAYTPIPPRSTMQEPVLTAFADSLIAFSQPVTIFDQELQTRWVSSVVSSGTVTQGAISKVILSTGATGGGAAVRTFGSNLSGFPAAFPGGTTGKWYVEFRARMTTAIDASAIVGLGDETILDIGVRGSVATGFWAARSNNGPTTITSTIAVDNGTFHRFRAYRNGATGCLQVDSETPTCAVAFFPTADCRLQLFSDNGGTAAARTIEYDYVFLRMDTT